MDYKEDKTGIATSEEKLSIIFEPSYDRLDTLLGKKFPKKHVLDIVV